MIWTVLGISVAVVAAYCIAFLMMLTNRPTIESQRLSIALVLAGSGIVVWVVGSLLERRRQAKATDADSRPLLLFNLRYWGPMLLIFSLVTPFVRPIVFSKPVVAPVQPKPVVRHEPVKAVPVIPKPELPPPPLVKFPEVRLQGVFFRARQPVVILEGKSYEIGDRVGAATVAAIDESGVTLEIAGRKKTLALK